MRLLTILALAGLLGFAACRSTILPSADTPDDVPAEFLFEYELDRRDAPAPAPVVLAPSTVAEPEPMVDEEPIIDMPAAEPQDVPVEIELEEPPPAPMNGEPVMTDEPMEEPEGTDEPMTDEPLDDPGSEGAETGETPEATAPESPRPLPQFLRLIVRADGRVTYEVDFTDVAYEDKSGEYQLSPEQVFEIYRRVQASGIETMETRHAGDEASLGKEVFHVVGQERRERWIDVKGVRVPPLTDLRDAILAMIADAEILDAPPPAPTGFVLDRRTAAIHRASCPLVQDIPAGQRRELNSVYSGLDLGGYICGECRPLKP